MSCLTVFTLVEALIFLAGILSPGWVRIVQESLAYGTNSTNYGLFYYMKCTRDGCLANTFYEDSFNHSYQGLLFVKFDYKCMITITLFVSVCNVNLPASI